MSTSQSEQDKIKAQLYDMQSELLQLQAKIGEASGDERSAYQAQARTLFNEYNTLRETLESMPGSTAYGTARDTHLDNLMNELNDSFNVLLKYSM